MHDIALMLIHVFLFISLYFEVFLLITFLERNSRSTISKPNYFPHTTIIVPCYNEEHTVANTLDSILALKYPANRLSIIAVDDGSTDLTLTVLRTYETHPQIKVISKAANGGKHTALNIGLSVLSPDTELVGCLDADSIVSEEALQEAVLTFEQDPSTMAVTPAIKVMGAQGILGLMQRAEYILSIFWRNTFSLIDGNFVTPGPFSIFRKRVFDELGPYQHGHQTEDCELALRMQSNFYKVGNAPRAIVYTNTPKTLRALIRQRTRWTYGFLRNLIDYRFMLFRPRFGNLGIFVLPIAALSIFSGIFMFIWLLWRIGDMVFQSLDRLIIMGPQLPSFSFDWFFVSTDSYLLVVAILIGMTLILLLAGMRLSGERIRIGFDVLLYLVCYGFIAPLWLSYATFRAMRASAPNWATERRRS